jgi:hypothetical protein
MKAHTLTRCLLSAAVVFMLPLAAHAQLLKGFGVKVGANSSSTSFAFIAPNEKPVKLDHGRRIGLNAAVFAEWLKAPAFSLVTQVEYARRGFVQVFDPSSALSIEPGASRAEAASRLDYVSLPLLFKARLQNSKPAPYIVVGPRIDWLVGHEDYRWKSEGKDQGAAPPVTDSFEMRTWGATAGLGLSPIALRGAALLVEARYNLDFNDSIAEEALRAKNNAVEVWLGVVF